MLIASRYKFSLTYGHNLSWSAPLMLLSNLFDASKPLLLFLGAKIYATNFCNHLPVSDQSRLRELLVKEVMVYCGYGDRRC